MTGPFELLTLGQALNWQFTAPFVARHRSGKILKFFRYYPKLREWGVFNPVTKQWHDTRGLEPPRERFFY